VDVDGHLICEALLFKIQIAVTYFANMPDALSPSQGVQQLTQNCCMDVILSRTHNMLPHTNNEITY
jgi:hypothetical protein